MRRVFSLPGKSHGNSRLTFKWQRKLANYLASAGSNRLVRIVDRNGNNIVEIDLPGNCTGMDWDKDGGVLAITQDKSAEVFFWDANSKKTTTLDTGLKGSLSFVQWSLVGPQLAIGSSNGSLILFNQQTARKVPILGKHSKRIVSGNWNMENMLCLASDERGEKAVSLSNSDGETVLTPVVHGEASDVQFYDPPADAPTDGGLHEAKISIVLDKKTLYLVNAQDPENPIELAFQAKYGNIVAYCWYGHGNIMLGFSSGYFVVVSTHTSKIGQEVYQSRYHKKRLHDIACSPALGKAATCGDNCVRLHDLSDLADIYAQIDLDAHDGLLDRLEWSDDGQLLSISMQDGALITFLTKLPVVGNACGTRIGYLSSLQEMAVVDPVGNERKVKIRIPVEPSFVAVGGKYFACGMNNRAWFFSINEEGAPHSMSGNPKEYLGSIKSMSLQNDLAAVLFDGQLQLHMIESDKAKLFPEQSTDGNAITCAALTTAFCIYGTQSGGIHYFLVEDWQFVNEYKHLVAITDIAADPTGTRLVFRDEKGDGFVYNPVNDAVIEVPDLPTNTLGFFWDNQPGERGTFIAFDDKQIVTYAYVPEHINGAKCVKLGTTERSGGLKPLMLYGGKLTCLTETGSTSDMVLATHQHIDINTCGAQDRRQCVAQNMRLGRFKEAFIGALANKQTATFLELATEALDCLEIETALNAYRAMGNAAMVNALQSVQFVEDRHLLAGHVALIRGDAKKAEELFLKSSSPIDALNMHRDLLHWDKAMKLAEQMAPQEIPSISREYAQQLEYQGEYQKALQLYEQGLESQDLTEEQERNIKAGIARTVLRNGDFQRGMGLAEELDQKQLYRDCAGILESMGQLSEAASMYEQGAQTDKAASIYIQRKNWPKVGELLEHISSPKLHAQYAKARESDGSYKEAAGAYELAKDYLSVIRINLNHLRDPTEAVRVVKETGSVDGAKMVAKFFEGLGDFASAIEFLVRSNCSDDALLMAQQHNQMDAYATAVGDGAAVDDYAGIAAHFEKSGNSLESGRFLMKAGEYSKALRTLLKCTNEEGAHIDLAIDTIGLARDKSLTKKLVDYLMGESDGRPKEPKYLFKLYMALKQYREAAKVAVIIAQEEQNAGNYRNAHSVLFDTNSTLLKNGVKVPSDMVSNLMILHSYILAKMHVKRGDHAKAAQLLMRVADNISKFKEHVVQILTSTVIECHRAGLKNSSFSYAAMLMRPEYRDKIDAKYRKKIETIVRKQDTTEAPEDETPCPYCGTAVASSQLSCHHCNNLIPYCVVTGFHMTKENWCDCPKCGFPALFSEMQTQAEAVGSCPMCSETVTADELELIADPSDKLKAAAAASGASSKPDDMV